MKELTIFKNEAKMTSVELAELTGKQHKHVMRDIREEVEKLRELNESIFGLVNYTDRKGEKRPCYTFGRKGAMQLALKYDAITRYKVIERLEELEKPNIPQTLPEALRLAADLAEQNSKLLVENTRMQPKAEYFDDLVDRHLLTSIRDTAKELKVKETSFVKYLMDNKYLYRDKKKKLTPYADKNDGLFELKEFVNDKTGFTGVQTLITPKGRETFRLLLPEA